MAIDYTVCPQCEVPVPALSNCPQCKVQLCLGCFYKHLGDCKPVQEDPKKKRKVPKAVPGVEQAIRTLIAYMGDDPDREGLKETPKRVIKAFDEMFAGYRQDVESLMKCFEDGVCDELVILKNIPFDSFCEHHLLSFSGVATIAYLPEKRIIGLSKLARLLDVFAKRLQVQERLTMQVTEALMKYLNPRGAGCIIKATHSCMSCRGVRKHGAEMVTCSLEGTLRNDPRTRVEFLQLAGG